MKKKLHPILMLSFLLILSLFSFNVEAASESLESKIKKIVMMMNIVAKEYEEGVVDGKIVVAAEYEESQVFLEQAENRFKRLPAPRENIEEIKSIATRFTDLTQKIKRKVDIGQVRPVINGINSGLMKTYAIKISQTPLEPVSLQNGKKIFNSKCSICHGIAGKGNGPLALQFDPAPAVLADPQLTGDDNTVPIQA
jgi:high-affinity iron transporter